jgi:hypothetical protein
MVWVNYSLYLVVFEVSIIFIEVLLIYDAIFYVLQFILSSFCSQRGQRKLPITKSHCFCLSKLHQCMFGSPALSKLQFHQLWAIHYILKTFFFCGLNVNL